MLNPIISNLLSLISSLNQQSHRFMQEHCQIMVPCLNLIQFPANQILVDFCQSFLNIEVVFIFAQLVQFQCRYLLSKVDAAFGIVLLYYLMELLL
jgi:hypothetical protein